MNVGDVKAVAYTNRSGSALIAWCKIVSIKEVLVEGEVYQIPTYSAALNGEVKLSKEEWQGRAIRLSEFVALHLKKPS